MFFIRKFVADVLANASNLLQIKCYLLKLRDEFSIFAINFSRYATLSGWLHGGDDFREMEIYGVN